jgi:hypothetical protein
MKSMCNVNLSIDSIEKPIEEQLFLIPTSQEMERFYIIKSILGQVIDTSKMLMEKLISQFVD